MEKYVFRKYNKEYLDFFKSEKKKLSRALGATARIEHVGSTAISNLGGKGILDIAVGVLKSKMAAAKKQLEQAGYEFRESASYPERLFFRIDYPYKNRKRRVHIHLMILNSQDFQGMIGFRQYLLNHPEAIEEYIKIKKAGVRYTLGDGQKYRKYKEKFIKNIVKKAVYF
ncbi:MAG: GrpB family protein [Candidatus Buchananbacteria bacterium]|nr:GrpB family protein [Candidatus Buchananbacteria bacterium]